MSRLSLFARDNFPLIQPGQPLLPAIVDALTQGGQPLADNDILVLAQKIVSKSENRFIDLGDIVATDEARDYAARCLKEPRFIQAVLNESAAVVRCVPNVFIVQHKLGFTLANAGIDQSNIDPSCINEEHRELALLLPQDPDASAAALRRQIRDTLGVNVGVVISDSFGRPWRLGTTGVCIGCAGVEPIRDQRGQKDLYGRTLQVTMPAIGDEMAAAACLLMGEASEGRPIAVLRGLEVIEADLPATALLRAGNEDLFR